jgi:hypothetical protein
MGSLNAHKSARFFDAMTAPYHTDGVPVRIDDGSSWPEDDTTVQVDPREMSGLLEQSRRVVADPPRRTNRHTVPRLRIPPIPDR